MQYYLFKRETPRGNEGLINQNQLLMRKSLLFLRSITERRSVLLVV